MAISQRDKGHHRPTPILTGCYESHFKIVFIHSYFFRAGGVAEDLALSFDRTSLGPAECQEAHERHYRLG